MINQIRASIKLNTLYTCSKCDWQQTGDTERHEISATSSGKLKKSIDLIPQRSSHMPDGWSYDGEFQCKECKEK